MAFFSHPALIARTVALSVMAGASLFAGGNLSSGVREGRGNHWIVTTVTIHHDGPKPGAPGTRQFDSEGSGSKSMVSAKESSDQDQAWRALSKFRLA